MLDALAHRHTMEDNDGEGRRGGEVLSSAQGPIRLLKVGPHPCRRQTTIADHQCATQKPPRRGPAPTSFLPLLCVGKTGRELSRWPVKFRVPGMVIGGLPEVRWTLGLRELPAAPSPVVFFGFNGLPFGFLKICASEEGVLVFADQGVGFARSFCHRQQAQWRFPVAGELSGRRSLAGISPIHLFRPRNLLFCPSVVSGQPRHSAASATNEQRQRTINTAAILASRVWWVEADGCVKQLNLGFGLARNRELTLIPSYRDRGVGEHLDHYNPELEKFAGLHGTSTCMQDTSVVNRMKQEKDVKMSV
ncbi:hypothetical protein Cgig2_014515 [Carnegiea gigantea]|uniref:Uncharacterized protein n=1 Tax=Carnegiea gigantea TaxID=171969 RepID=A0A9Q1QHQ2_9CARY|nr:hypothetical protein Cgig2_014515 [Carnegiea gigantea]